VSKIELDKYYTPKELAKYCIDKTYQVIGENISEVIEPSAGNGSFSLQIPSCYAYDIAPEHESIVKQDFLNLDISYLKGRLIIGNPPFGRGNSLSMAFYKKSVKIADYIAFILPISQLNNNVQLYDFDLVYSEDLGEQMYSNKKLHCCFNIYKRPANGNLNPKPNYKLKDVEIVEYRRKNRNNRKVLVPPNYDYAMGTFGAGCVGKEVKKSGQYAQEYYFYIKNPNLKVDILNILKSTDWKELSKGIAGTYRLPQWKIYKHIKEQLFTRCQGKLTKP